MSSLKPTDFQKMSVEDWLRAVDHETKSTDKPYPFEIEMAGLTAYAYYAQTPQILFPYPENACIYPKIAYHITVKNASSANQDLLEALSWGIECVFLHLDTELVQVDWSVLFHDVWTEAVTIHIYGSFVHQAALQSLPQCCPTWNGTIFWVDAQGSILPMTEQIKNIYKNQLPQNPYFSLAMSLKDAPSFVLSATQVFKQLHEFSAVYGKNLWKLIHLHVNMGSDFFAEIAQLQSLQIIWAELLKQQNLTFFPLPVHVSSPASSHAAEEAHQALLAHTTQALSAVLGGCHDLSLQHHQQSPDFYPRISVNIQHILKHESKMDKVNHSIAGSYLISDLSQKIAGEVLSHIRV